MHWVVLVFFIREQNISAFPSPETREVKSLQTGPYAVVRHPLYTSVLLQGLLFTLMSWSYAPLVGFGITAGALAVKMPIEVRGPYHQDPDVAAEYRAYMQRVPVRVIPFIW
ncbi:hypothetical protein BDR07DRAFT_1485102 [Suillus spraguei]|nr:hypothetical protein BDR07DRAFT_1485102 [Suillus spraguei]